MGAIWLTEIDRKWYPKSLKGLMAKPSRTCPLFIEEPNMQVNRLKDLQTLVSLAKRRGIIFQSSEIYGGLNSCWDYGPLGSQFKYNVKQAWWKAMTRRRDIVGLDAAILMHPKVWHA